MSDNINEAAEKDAIFNFVTSPENQTNKDVKWWIIFKFLPFYKQFQQQQNSAGVWVKASEKPEKEGWYLCKWRLDKYGLKGLYKWNGKFWTDELNMQLKQSFYWLDESATQQLTELSDAEIEAMAEKEFPVDKSEIDDYDWNKDERNAFIKGYKAAINKQ